MIRLPLLAFAALFVAAQDPTPQTQAVKKGTLTLAVDVEGSFEAVDPFEVRVRPKSYKGDLTVVAAAAHGGAVRKGDVLLQLDADPLKKQIDAAESDLKVARATLAKTEKEGQLSEQGDALALKASEQELKNAEANVQYWEKMDGPHLLKDIELEVLGWRDQVSDQEEELDQLKKMYKSEDLTNATSEIVVKRAVRQLDRTKARAKMGEEAAQKRKDFDAPNAARKVGEALEAAKLALAQLQNTQALSKVSREAELFKAKAAVTAAEESAADLKADLEALAVKAPSDGIVLYGQMQAGAWQSGDLRALTKGEKVQAAVVLMTLYAPGRFSVVVDLPESQAFWIKAGMKAGVTPVGIPEAKIEGTARAPAIVGSNKGAGQVFAATLDLPPADARLTPGMKATVHVDVADLKDVLLVPTTAVSHGRVWVKGKDGSEEARAVVVGKSDGAQTEIKSGVSEGDEVLIQAKK